MANLDTALRKAMLLYAPDLEQDYKNFVRSMFGSMVSDLGPDLKGVYNSPRWARTFSGVVRSNVTNADPNRSGVSVFADRPYRIEEPQLNVNAKRYGEEVSTAWFGKMRDKLGDISDVEVTPPSSDGSITISGKHDGDAIRVEQHRIVNVSPLGTLFHQWPALIYINNKKKSEAAYRKIADSWGVKSLKEEKPKKPPIDVDSRPKEYYFDFMVTYLDQPSRVAEKRRESAKSMSPEEAQAKIINSHRGWGMRLFDFRLSTVYAWNGKLIWKASSGEPSPAGLEFPDMTLDIAVEVVRAARRPARSKKSVSGAKGHSETSLRSVRS